MKTLRNILPIGLLLFFAISGWAQDDVVVHSDPRLSLLLKKNHTPVASAAKPVVHKSAGSNAASLANGEATIPHPAEVLTAPHAGEMAVKTNARPTVAAVVPNPPAAASPAVAKPPVVTTVWAPHRNVRTIYSGKGYRVQIYSGTDRNKAMEIKNDFARNNPGVRTYLSYVSPCFRVKVGNYRRRSDAEGMWREANSTYNPSMIVPDIVTITTTE